MPITAEYKWEQTKAAVSLLVPLRGAKPNTSDVFVSAEYVKINSMPYFLELDLRNSIVPSKARAVFEPQGLRLFLPKAEPCKWSDLVTELEKEERVERREASIEARHEELRQEKVAGKKERIDDDQKALRRSMELENEKKQWVEDRKAEEFEKYEDQTLNFEEKEKAAAAMLLEDEETEEEPCSSEAAPKPKPAARRRKPIEEAANLPPPRCSNVVRMTFTKTTRPTPARADNADKLGPNDAPRSRPILKRLSNPDAVDIGEQNPDWLKDRGDKYVQMGDFQSAESAYSAAIALDDDQYVDTIAQKVASYYSNRALCYMQLTRFKNCASDCDRALALLREYESRQRHELPLEQQQALSVRMSRVLARRASAHAQLGEVLKSREDFEQAIKLCAPEHREALEHDLSKLGGLELKLQADSATREGRYDDALLLYVEALSIDGSNPSVHSNMALCHLAMGEHEHCVSACSQCIQILDGEAGVGKPAQLAKVLARRGSALSELRRLKEAFTDFERACELIPSDTTLQKDCARIGAAVHRANADESFSQGELELALAEYELGLALDETSAPMLANQATCLLQLQKYDQCIEVCNSAVEVLQAKPKMLASVLVRRGSALGKIGQYSRALDDLNKAIELQPSFAASLENDLKALHEAS